MGSRVIAAQSYRPGYLDHPMRMGILTPDGAKGQQPYQLIRDVMSEADVEAVAKAVLSNREQLVLVRPIDRLLESKDRESLSIVASRGRLERLRRMLVSTSRRYNLAKAAPVRDLAQ